MEKQAKNAALVHTHVNQSPSFRRPAGYVSLSRLWLKYHLPPGARFQCIYIYIHIHTKLTHMLKLCVLTWAHRWNESSSHTGHTIGLQRRGHANMPKRCVEFFTCMHMCYWCLNRLEGLDRSYRYLLGDNFGRGQIVENRVMDKSSHECISMKYNHITHASDIVHAIQHPPAGT